MCGSVIYLLINRLIGPSHTMKIGNATGNEDKFRQLPTSKNGAPVNTPANIVLSADTEILQSYTNAITDPGTYPLGPRTVNHCSCWVLPANKEN